MSRNIGANLTKKSEGGRLRGKHEYLVCLSCISQKRPNLPFQIVETVNKPRVKDGTQKSLFPEKDWTRRCPENYPKEWKNKLIWGDNKLVMSSLLKDFAGKINLIYIDPPFFTGADFTVKTKVGDEEVTKEPSIIEEKVIGILGQGAWLLI